MGIIYIIGLGPGEEKKLTPEARECLDKSDIIIGYTVYIDLVKAILPYKEYITTPMRQEIERCRMCFEMASEGKCVSLVCSGDAGIYGMASPMYELQKEYENCVLQVVPGITAASSGAAVLGAPLNHDFCVISLSDLLTPWETIKKRLEAAIMGDFAIAIYNPSSHKRHDYLMKACDIMMAAGASADRACGYVRNIGRDGQEAHAMILGELRNFKADMFMTVFVGNSESYIKNDKLITKRGYKS